MARKILLADDSVTAQNMGRKILTDAGYEVTTVNNGSAALKRVAEQRPDLIVLDVYMPGYSGLEVCQRLKDSRDTSRIPILLTVGKLEPFKPEDARRVAADAFIVKPFEASELLSALTRLEDRIVPEGEVSRFSANVSGIDRFAGDPSVKRGSTDEGEQGWKSRIRFPAKKAKKDEPEPEPDYVTPPPFRDLRAGPSEKKAEAKPQSEARPASQEPGLVPDIPRDITPDELDALSALVAKLDGPIPQNEEIAPLGDTIGSTGGVTEAKSEVAAPSPDQAAAAAGPTPEVEPESEAIPAAETRLETSTAEPHVDSTETVAPDYTPAPIDRDDEPFFATAAAAVPPPSVEAEASIPGQTDTPTPTGQASLAEQTPAPVQESELALCKEDVVQKDQAKVEEMVAEAVAEEAIAEQATVEERVPTDEELADALRLLTPVHDNASAAASAEQQPSESASERPMAYAAAAAHSGNGSRWTAVPVELSSEEKSLSLEAEMFRAVAPAAIPKMVSSAAFEVPFAHEAVIGAAEGEVAESSITAHADAAAARAATTPVPPPTSEAAMEANAAPALDSVVESAVQESAPTTFASQAETVDSDGKDTESGSQTVGEQVTATTAASERDAEVTGDQQSMGKHAKADQGKGSKAGWHQIHATTPNASTDVETAKHEPRADEGVKTMAAAAASDDTSAPDPNAIASIVDSVLADLRPRIVEEIAKKLSKK